MANPDLNREFMACIFQLRYQIAITHSMLRPDELQFWLNEKIYYEGWWYEIKNNSLV